VTTAVTDWTPVFLNPLYARQAIAQLRETTDHHDVAVVAYVLMPSHLHALLGMAEIGLLSRLVQSFRSLTARRLKPMLAAEHAPAFFRDNRFTLWRPRFDDLVVWSEDQFRIKAEYIHNNPVRAGLVSDPADYPFSSARYWSRGEPGPIEVETNWSWQTPP
jgi:putative transposase